MRRPGRIWVAIGNASLLGIGYLMVRRWRSALVTTVATVCVVVVQTVFVRAMWLDLVVLLWWVALIVHGSRVAATVAEPAGGVRVRRAVALAVTLLVVGVVVVLRMETVHIDRQIAEARRGGDCVQGLLAAARLWIGDRVAAAPRAASIERTDRACALLRRAADEFSLALTGDTSSLAKGFALLDTVLTELPGHGAMARRVLDDLLRRLPDGSEDCAAAAVTDWLAEHPFDDDVRRRATDAVPAIAPWALFGCAADLMTVGNWAGARDRYQHLLDQYPRHPLVDQAKAGLRKAVQAIELATVRGLLQPQAPGAQPAYCRAPQPYSAAAPYRSANPNRALLFGNDFDTAAFPAEWRAADAADAVIVICAGPTEFGDVVETCTYRSELTHRLSDVPFHKKAIPLRVFEVRTGKPVLDTRIQITGATCPPTLFSTADDRVGAKYVQSADADVRTAFNAVINP
ncbi:tetratricopeptide repeat protein [Nocardia brasiliensis]